MIIAVDIIGISKPKQGLLIRDTIEQALLHLLPRRRLPILIDCHIALKEDLEPAKAMIHQESNDVFFLAISQELLDNEEELIETICHECVHIKQYLRKELLELGRDTHRWKGKLVNSKEVEYYDLPWEKEAYKMEIELAEKVKSIKNV